MSTTCTRTLARRHQRTVGGRRPGDVRCPSPTPRATTLDGVLRRVGRREPMTLPELRAAARVLARHAHTRRMDVAVAQVRVAVRLEALGS